MMARIGAPIVALLLLAACADDDSSVERGTAVVTPTTVTATTVTPTTVAATTVIPTETAPVPGGTTATVPEPAPTPAPPTASSPPVPEPTVGDPNVTSVAVAQFEQPVDLAFRTDDASLYIVEQGGRVVRLTSDGAGVVADLSDRTESDSEQGLLGLAFSSDGSLAYVDYTDLDGDTVIAEYPVNADGQFDVAAERVLLTVEQPYGNHNGGDLEIGPDGMLFVALGDGGSGGDPQRYASDPSTLLGSLLRIDPRPSSDHPYTIPADNPFASGPFNGITGAPEVWAWGLRNPWRFAFDPINGDLWIADVGQNEIEEVNHVTAIDGTTAGRGADFGWSAFEGTERFNADVADTNPVMPVLTYRHGDDGCSISGGVPYRGAAIPDLEPAYVYSDYCSGIVWALDLVGGRNLTLLDGFSSVSTIRAGPDGELYLLERGGTLHRLIPG